MTIAAVTELQKQIASLPPDLRSSVEHHLNTWLKRDASISFEHVRSEAELRETREDVRDLRREMEAVACERDLLQSRCEAFENV